MSERPTVEQLLETLFARPPVAFSADGGGFRYTAPLDGGVPLGGFVRIAHDGEVLLGQIISQEIASTQGPELDIETAGPVEVRSGVVRGGRYHPIVRRLAGAGVLHGRLHEGLVEPIGSLGGFGDRPMVEASAADVAAFMTGAIGDRAQLHVGQVEVAGETVPAVLRAEGFARHTFLCGQSGSGKTYSLGVVLERLLVETDLRIVVLDPNSDHVGLGSARDGAEGADRYRQRAAGVRVASGADLRLRFSDLDLEGQTRVLGLHPLSDRHEYRALPRAIERLGRERYTVGDLLSALGDAPDEVDLRLRIENLGVERWGLWCGADEPSVVEQFMADDWRVFVADLGSLATAEERSLIAAGAFTRLWRAREQRRPTMIVIDEAHNVCPDLPEPGTQARATELAVLVAGEGRKYGLYLLVATQRPQKVHPNVVSQCENLILMRLNSTLDLQHLQEVFSHVPSALLGRAPAFRQGDALIAGRIAVAPMAVRIGGRISPEGGSDVPADWADQRD